MSTMDVERLRQMAETVWRKDATPPPAEVMAQMEGAAQRGYAWCVVALDKLSGPHLHWLSLEGYRVKKLMPRSNEGHEQGAWRIEWAFNLAEKA